MFLALCNGASGIKRSGAGFVLTLANLFDFRRGFVTDKVMATLRNFSTGNGFVMRKVIFSILFAVMLLAVVVMATAQQPTKIPRIGYLSASSAAVLSARVEAFRQGLRELGTWREETLSLTGDMLTENSTASARNAS